MNRRPMEGWKLIQKHEHPVTSMVEFQGSVYVATGNQVYRLKADGSVWEPMSFLVKDKTDE